MRRIICIMMSLMLLLPAVPAVSAQEELPYTVYDINFDDGTAGALEFNLDTKLTEDTNGKVLSVVPGENNEVFRTILGQLEKKCRSSVFVKMRLTGEEKTAYGKLVVRVNTNGTNTDYILDSKTMKNGAWTQFKANVDTTFMTYGNDLQLFFNVDSNGVQQSFDIDDFVVKSEKLSKTQGIVPVPDIKSQYDGNLLMRAAFEKNTAEIFETQDADLEYTDEVPAHTGQFSCKVTNRTDDWNQLTVRIVEPTLQDAKYTVSAWVKKDPKVQSERFSIQECLATYKDGTKWNLHSTMTVNDDEWHYIEATIDGRAYAPVKTMGFRITNGDGNRNEYYVDDFIVRADVPGKFYDDMDFDENYVAEGMSKTPTSNSPKYIPIQDDIPVLKDVFKDYFKIGACCNVFENYNIEKSRHLQLIAKHFNSMVHDGAMKTSNILDFNQAPKRVYNFSIPDQMMDFATQNGIDDIAGHTLTWESVGDFGVFLKNENGDPVSADEAHVIMKEYTQKVIRHLEGDGDPEEYTTGTDHSKWHISVWDIANEEVFAGDEVYANKYGYAKIMGSNMEYMYWAHRYAKEAGDYGIKFRYNDYGEQDESKRRAVYDFMKRLEANDVYCQVLGIQSHYRTNVLPVQIRKAFELYSSLGLELNVTELDLAAYTDNQVQQHVLLYEDGLPTAVEMTQANFYYELFQIYREFADSLGRVTFWSFEDLNNYQNRSDDFRRTDYAGIFDRNYQAKPQFWAIADPDYFFSDILKEDTSKVRVVIDGITLDPANVQIREKDGVTYVACEDLLNELKIEFVKIGDRYSFIRKGHYLNVADGKSQKVDFKDHDFENELYSENGVLFVPAMELCELMEYSVEYNEKRNIVGISSNQVSNNL